MTNSNMQTIRNFARRPDLYDLPALRAAAAALGLDPDKCTAVGVDAVPAMA